MIEPEHLPMLRREDLLALVDELQRQIAALTATNEALRAGIDQLTRGGKRKATPFSKGTRVTEPKPPGRKPGSGTFCYREGPPPEAITESPVDVVVLGQVVAEETPDVGRLQELQVLLIELMQRGGAPVHPVE